MCVWYQDGGIASLITTDGPEKNTVQWSADGINFDIKSVIKRAPHAIGDLLTSIKPMTIRTFEVLKENAELHILQKV